MISEKRPAGRSAPARLRLLLDCDPSSHALHRLLSHAGHDAVAAGHVRAPQELDHEDLFALAQRERRIVITHNLADFPDILVEWGQSGSTHHGCILSRLAAHEVAEIARRLNRWFVMYPTQRSWTDLAVWL